MTAGLRRGPAAAVGAAALVVALAACTAGTAPDEVTVVVSARAEYAGPTGGVQAVPAERPTVRATPLPVPVPTPTGPVYTASVGPITDELAARMSASWRPGCPVPLEDLRYVTLAHWDMAGAAVTGELVVHADVADSVVAVFGELFALGFPIASMRLVDDFGGSDDASMAADNTSAFNCRAITGGTSWSEHAYGRAIDVNPVENPYVRSSGRAAPRAGQSFVDRHAAPGVIQADDAVVRAFAAHGWQWGGYWDYPIDYQHFSTTGR